MKHLGIIVLLLVLIIQIATLELKIPSNQVNPSVYFVGCPSHIIHNAAQKAARDVCGIDIQECCVDHYYWFDKSTK